MRQFITANERIRQEAHEAELMRLMSVETLDDVAGQVQQRPFALWQPVAWPQSRAVLTQTTLAMLVVFCSVAVWMMSLQAVNVRGMTDIGLVSVLPMSSFIALGGLTLGFCLSIFLAKQAHPWTPLFYLLALIFMLYATPTLIEQSPRFDVTYWLAGHTDYILRNGAANRFIDAYFNWPGFFVVTGLLTRVTGSSSVLALAPWASLVYNLMYLMPMYLIYTTATRDRRLVWLGLWFFYITDWVWQDYFSPQGLNVFLYLVIIAILLKWFRTTQPTSGILTVWHAARARLGSRRELQHTVKVGLAHAWMWTRAAGNGLWHSVTHPRDALVALRAELRQAWNAMGTGLARDRSEIKASFALGWDEARTLTHDTLLSWKVGLAHAWMWTRVAGKSLWHAVMHPRDALVASRAALQQRWNATKDALAQGWVWMRATKGTAGARLHNAFMMASARLAHGRNRTVALAHMVAHPTVAARAAKDGLTHSWVAAKSHTPTDWQADADQTRLRQRLAPWLALSDTPLSGEQRKQRIALLVALLAIFALSIFSHPITPLFVLLTVTVLVLFGQCTPRWLPILMAAMILGWDFTVATPYMAGHLSSDLATFGNLQVAATANVSNRLAAGNAAHNFVAHARLMTTAAILGFAAIGAALRWRRHSGRYEGGSTWIVGSLFSHDLKYTSLAVAPFVMIAVQPYGGEMAMRCYLIALPFIAFFAAAAFCTPLVGKYSRPFTVPSVIVTSAACLALLTGFMFARYGNERGDYITYDESNAVSYLYSIAPPNSLLYEEWLGAPWKYTDLEKYTYRQMYSDPVAITQHNITDVLGAASTTQYPATYVIITRSQKAQAELYYDVQPAVFDEVERALLASGRFVLMYTNPDADILMYVHPPQVSPTGHKHVRRPSRATPFTGGFPL